MKDSLQDFITKIFTQIKNNYGNIDNTSDSNKPVSIAQRKAIDDAYANSNAYTDQKIADLIGGAPETLDTLKEVADAIAESKDVETALNSAIGTKANQAELDTHTGNDTIHITADERTALNDANSKKHTHSNKSVIDKITQTLLDAWNAAYTHISDTVKHITEDERIAWNNKYDKPTSGIPKSDLASAVQTSLGKADTALQAHQDISGLATKTELTAHINNTDNPHSVTKSQVGLGNADNTSDKDKPISTKQQKEFDKLNNNLDALEYSDVAGGKNIFNQSVIDENNPDVKGIYLGYRINANNQYTISITEKDSSIDISGIFFGVTRNGYNSEDGYEWLIINGSIMNNSLTVDSSYEFISFYKDNDLVGIVEKILQRFNIQIEYGQATEYEPYIPSVKILSKNVTDIDCNLDGLKVGENCGGKNLWDEQWTNGVYNESDGLFTPIYNYVCSKNKIKVKPNTIYSFVSPEIYHYIYQYDVNGNYIGRINVGIADVFSTNNNVEYIQFVMETGYGTTYNHDISIIEGTSGTYEPYIPSVKMLAEETERINDSLADYGLNNVFDDIWEFGKTTSATDGSPADDNRYALSDKYNCSADDLICFKYGRSCRIIRIAFYDSSNTFLTYTDISNVDNINIKAPTNASCFIISISHDQNNISGILNASLYINNQIDGLKNDLDTLQTDLPNTYLPLNGGGEIYVSADTRVNIGKDGSGNVVSGISVRNGSIKTSNKSTSQSVELTATGSADFTGFSGKKVSLSAPAMDNNVNVTLPSKAGTLALKSDLDGKMNASNPTGTGSFSLNRKSGTTVGIRSFAEGHNTTASGVGSHAEGYNTTASSNYSHAEGIFTTASGNYSHAEGRDTIANGDYQHVQGRYNVADTTSAFIIGNGEDDSARSNAMKVDWSGNLEVAGDLKDGNGNTLLTAAKTTVDWLLVDKSYKIKMDGVQLPTSDTFTDWGLAIIAFGHTSDPGRDACYVCWFGGITNTPRILATLKSNSYITLTPSANNTFVVKVTGYNVGIHIISLSHCTVTEI